MSLRISPANQQLIFFAVWGLTCPGAADRRALGGRSSVLDALIYSLVRPSGVAMLRWSITSAVRSSTARLRRAGHARCRVSTSPPRLGAPPTAIDNGKHARHTPAIWTGGGGVHPRPFVFRFSFRQQQRRRHAATWLEWKRCMGMGRERRRLPICPPARPSVGSPLREVRQLRLNYARHRSIDPSIQTVAPAAPCPTTFRAVFARMHILYKTVSTRILQCKVSVKNAC